MIVIYGSIRLKAEEVAGVQARIPAFLEAIRAEDGYLGYDLTWDAEDPQTLHLLEHWDSADSYEAHRVQPHVTEWAQMMSGVAEGPLNSKKFRAEAYV